MPGVSYNRLAHALLLALVALAAPAAAQMGMRPTSPPVVEQELTPPKLVTSLEPQLPADAQIAPDAYVVVELLVDPQGAVAEVSVIESSDDTLAAAEVEAAKHFVFEPAHRGDEPVSARIRFRYGVPAGTAVPPAQPPAPATAAEPPPPPVLAPLPPPAAEPPAAEPSGQDASFAATARTEAPPREVTRRPLKAERVAKLAGANNDPLRAVETLPGVARPPLNDTVLLVRGAGADDSVVMVDGTPVLLLFHIGGFKSFMNASLLDRVDFFPGNFSARYGRAIGGALDARLRAPRGDRFHGVADISFLDASLLLEGPISDCLSVAVAGRRSWIDALLAGNEDFVAAPVYWDYQALASYRPSSSDEVYFQGFGSKDSLALLLPDDGDPALAELRGQLSASTQFHRGLLGWKHRYGGGYAHDIKLGLGYIEINADIGELVSQRAKAPDLYGRADFHLPLAPEWLTLDTGVDFVGLTGTLRYEGPQYRQQEVDPTSDLTPMVLVDRHVDVMRPAAYAELSIKPLPPLTLIPGVRANYFGDIEASSIDPRFVARYTLSDATTLKAGVGRYSQPPELGSAIEGLGNPNLDPTWALHVSAGVEQKLGKVLSIDVEGYYKHVYDMVVNTPDGGDPRLENEGEGRIIGLETALDLDAGDLFGSLAYTLSRSERSDHGAGYVLFDYDQPHVLTVAAGYVLGAGWQVSGTFRLVSGNPDTPVEGAVYAADTDRYLPIFGPPNSTREPLFHRLDLRVEKRFAIGSDGSLTVYLDVQNAYDARRPEATAYSYDFRTTAVVHSLPLIPVLGLKGEL